MQLILKLALVIHIFSKFLLSKVEKCVFQWECIEMYDKTISDPDWSRIEQMFHCYEQLLIHERFLTNQLFYRRRYTVWDGFLIIVADLNGLECILGFVS